MNDSVDRLASALSDRDRIESEVGAGGMARKAVRRYGGRAVEAGAL